MAIGRAGIIAVLAFWSSVSLAQNTETGRSTGTQVQRGMSKDEAACRPDVRRYCRDVPENAGDFAFLACLQQNRSRISKACNEVLVRHGQ